MRRISMLSLAMVAVSLLALLITSCAEEEKRPSRPRREDLRPFVASDPSEYPEEIRQDMRCIVIPMYVYYLQVGVLPTTEEGLEALISGPKAPELYEKFAGPYLVPDQPDVLVDPWGRGYVYRRAEDAGAVFDLRSLGPDGVESSDDISYREFPEIANLIR